MRGFLQSGVVAVLLLCLSAPFASAEPVLTIGSAAVPAGNSVQLSLHVSQGVDPSAGFNARLVLPAGVSFESIAPGAALPAGFTLDARPSDGGVSILAYSLDQTVGSVDGELAVVTLLTDSGLADGPLGLKFDGASSAMANVDASARISLILENGFLVIGTGGLGPSLSLVPSFRELDALGGETTFDVSNVGSGTMDWTATADVEWLSVTSGGAGTNGGTVTVAVMPNQGNLSRMGSVTVVAPGAVGSSAMFLVDQAGATSQTFPVLGVNPDLFNLRGSPGVGVITVTNDGIGQLDWNAQIVEGAEWLTIFSGMSGVNDGIIEFDYAPNRTNDTRVARIRIFSNGLGSPRDVTFVQEALVLDLTSPNGGEQWDRGEQRTITWSTTDPSIAAVTVMLIKGGNFHRTISLTTDNSGAYNWTVPLDLVPANDYQIQIADVTSLSAHDESDADFAISCPPAIPVNVTASDGDPGRVRIAWDSVPGATSYDVLRSLTDDPATATVVATVTEPFFDDFDIEPASGPVAFQCSNLMTTGINHYWVRSLSVCAASDLSVSDDGFRTRGAKSFGPSVYAAVLPNATMDGETYFVAPDGAVSVRLRSEEAIDPDSIWGGVTRDGVENDAVIWVPTAENDGWVVFEHADDWLVGEQVTMIAGAFTLSGQPIETSVYHFEVVDGDTSSIDTIVYELDRANGLVPLDGAITSAFEVEPARPYETPQLIWLPLPEGLTAGDVEIWYYHPEGNEAGWYSSDNVEGWLVPDSMEELHTDGQVFLGIDINHGATIQLTLRQLDAPLRSANLMPNPKAWGDILVLMTCIGLSFIIGVRRKTTRR